MKVTCPKCKGEGFLIIEDVENYYIKECSICNGEGVIDSE
jgi:DnaJ-class molecular chaperone